MGSASTERPILAIRLCTLHVQVSEKENLHMRLTCNIVNTVALFFFLIMLSKKSTRFENLLTLS